MRKTVKFGLISLLLALSIYACKPDDTGQLLRTEPQDNTIELHFYQNDSETKEEFEIGLQWGFSYLGATLEKGSWSNGTNWIQQSVIQIDLQRIGFSNEALIPLSNLVSQFKNSQEYTVTGAIDAGRFIACILNNPNHYYEIVGQPKTLNTFAANYSFLSKRAAIIESAVAFKEREIRLPARNIKVEELGYWAEEMRGSLKDSTHKVIENEVMDIMPNGQLRFGVYDTMNQRLNGSDPSISIAGKPIKCLWCHEVNIQRGFAALTQIPGYYTPVQFDSIVAKNSNTLTSYRAALNTEINFTDNSQHTEIEKLYIRYFEPSAKRLAQEWNLTLPQVDSILAGIGTHVQPEFTEMGDLYHRDEIMQYHPYKVLPSTESARETVENEPNLLR